MKADEIRHPVTAKMCMTKDVGTHGNLFGGIMMGWLDEAGAIFARTWTGEKHVVTVKFSEIVFKRPVKVGEIVRFEACDPKVGRTSITFEIAGRVGESTVVRTTCTFVALSDDGTPRVINADGNR
ncbi:MAG: putative acyl-CoA thioester hydrolase [Calditrichaeota bacterium]|nr:putative acyl-CoA thioester hydrolase [Calditrichota bacterium]